MLILNAGIGLITPPVGSVLFVGTAIGKISIAETMRTIWPFYLAGAARARARHAVPGVVAVAAERVAVSAGRALDEILEKQRVVAVVTIERAADALPLADALCAGGVRVIEITLRTDAACSAIEAIAKARPEAIVGAGTVRDARSLRAARDAGAQFVVSPGFTPALHAAAAARRVAVAAGRRDGVRDLARARGRARAAEVLSRPKRPAARARCARLPPCSPKSGSVRRAASRPRTCVAISSCRTWFASAAPGSRHRRSWPRGSGRKFRSSRLGRSSSRGRLTSHARGGRSRTPGSQRRPPLAAGALSITACSEAPGRTACRSRGNTRRRSRATSSRRAAGSRTRRSDSAPRT